MIGFNFGSPIYPIVGDTNPERDPVDLAQQVLGCGLPLIQLRLKSSPTGAFVKAATAIQALCVQYNAKLIINDRADIAKLIGAAGVHVGQDDLPPKTARDLLPAGAIIGYSTHNLDQLVKAAREEPLDYVAYGPIFPTESKVDPDPTQGIDALRAAASSSPLPLVAIGGISENNVAQVLKAGADTAAIIGAIGNAVDPVAATELMITAAQS